MALVLDTTPGGATSNGYCTVAEAGVYHEGHVAGPTWFALASSLQVTTLVMATRLLDDYVEWDGTKTTRTQALRWPRTGVSERDGAGTYYDTIYGGYVIDPMTIPGWLKNAAAELARYLAEEDRTVESDMLEFKAMSIGSLSMVKDDARQKDVLPDSVRVMVQPYGIVETRSGIGMAQLVRA